MSTSMNPLLLSAGDSLSSEQRQQRVFTESDETKLLKAYLRTASESSKTTTITTQSLDAIEASLSSRFSHSQIVDKLRRLRLKYHRHARTKSLIKTPHDQRLFFIARRIWGKRQTTPKTPKQHREEAKRERLPRTRSAREEEFVALREELCGALPGNGVWEKGLGCLGREIVRGFNEQWVLLRMEEAELMTRKAELVNELIHLVVDALGSSTS